MENYQGDLADIVRATGGGGGGGSAAESGLVIGGGQQQLTNWQQLIMSNPLEQVIDDEFGDPFSNAGDPLFHDHDHERHLDMAAATAGSCFFDNCINNNIRCSNMNLDGDGDGVGGEVSRNTNTSILISPKIGDEEIIRRGRSAAGGSGVGDNIFSRMLQISPSANNKLSSPCDSPAAAVAVATAPLLKGGGGGGGLKVNNSSKSSFVENGGVQISSPSSTGIKRR